MNNSKETPEVSKLKMIDTISLAVAKMVSIHAPRVGSDAR